MRNSRWMENYAVATVNALPAGDEHTDAALVQRILAHDHRAFELLMRRYNARLYRVARAIVKHDADAEDVLQEAYLSAYRSMDRFRGAAQLSTWLTRIVVNQALGRLRASKRERIVVEIEGGTHQSPPTQESLVNRSANQSPEQIALLSQLQKLLEHSIEALPLAFRTVFVLREVEDMSVAETADCLSIPAATVRSRLHRARGLLRESLAVKLDSATGGIFPFAGARCDGIVLGVLGRLCGNVEVPGRI
jgi:RNA polymerase sigma-70 factor (ECF subfamily)